jgi:hypothetical protein
MEADTLNIKSTNMKSIGSIQLPIEGELVAGTNVTPVIIAHTNMTLLDTKAYSKTAPNGANIIIDVLVNSVSIYGSKLEIVDTLFQGQQSTIVNPSIVEGDIITVNLDTVGSTVSGSDLTIMLKMQTGLGN